jgi:hypothetical protein
MKSLLYVAVPALAVAGAPASAAILDFTITNVGGQNFGNYSFSLDDTRLPNIVLSDNVRYSTPAIPITYTNVPNAGSGTINSGVTFFAPIQQGGLQIGFLPFGNFRLINTTLVENTSFSSQTLPVFRLGTFAISTTAQNNGPRPFDNYQITIAAAASAVPEPTTWAMLLMGFGAVGYSMRRRNIGQARMRIQAI